MTATTTIPITYFAPPERVPIEVIHRQASSLSDNPFASAVLDSVLNYVFVLNAQRQIIFASRNVLDLVPGKTMKDILGLRPGEALGCVHAEKCESGCGTSEFCGQCGGVRSILASLAGARGLQECHLTRMVNFQEQPLDLLVLATPFVHNQERYSIVSLADISHENRRRVLERIFFHDVLNLAGGADGLLEELSAQAPADLRNEVELSHTVVHELLEEVQAHRDLTAGEQDELAVTPTAVAAGEVLCEMVSTYQRHPVAEGKTIRLAPGSAAVTFTTDARLLRRVLGNLIKNAVEACETGQAVMVGCESLGNAIRFSVHNPSFMPREIQLQVFQRSFSTKGGGRGLGTYSVKLLSEKYLKGQVGFTTSPESGTTFHVMLPMSLESGRTPSTVAQLLEGAGPSGRVSALGP